MKTRSGEKYSYLAGFLLSAVLIGLSVWLRPDPRGYGTHKQLGLPPCGFEKMCGVPGPSCGFTTSFAHQAHGNIRRGFTVQPMGSLLFYGVLLIGLTCLIGLFRSIPVFEWIARHLNPRYLVVFLILWIMAWIYKLQHFAQ